MKGKKVTEGPKPMRSDNVTMRFDPRLKYLASVVGRYERRTLSTVVEMAVESYVSQFAEKHLSSSEPPFYNMTAELWSPSEVMRFALLADEQPALLTFEEEILWRLMSQDDSLWSAPLPGGVRNKLRLDRAQAKWPSLVAKAEQLAKEEANITVGKSKS